MNKGIRLLTLSVLALNGCSLKMAALRSTADLLDRGAAAFYEEEDVPLAQNSMAGHLKLLEILLKNDPANPKLLLNAARGFGGYAFLFLEDKEPQRAKIFYARGKGRVCN